MNSSYLPLKDGDRIAIIGGGPAGSLFAHFTLQHARQAGLRLDVAVLDGKSFPKTGPAGCNMCAGVVAANFVQELEEAGIPLPDSVVQRQIEGYRIETPVGSFCLRRQEAGRICTVFRGGGPRGSIVPGKVSFDDYLLEYVKSQGARVVPQHVSSIELPPRPEQPVRLTLGPADRPETCEAELVVGAFGLHSRLGEQVRQLGFGYRPAASMSSVQAEVWFGADYIQRVFGNYIYVYELRLPRVKFAAVTPKHDYLTVTMVGDSVTEKDVAALFEHPVVRRKLPEAWQMPDTYCHCRPRVAVSACRVPYTDRVVIVGDASTSRLYKNGLESSFLTARAAASAALRHGVSAGAFREHYYPALHAIARDARYGRLLFAAHDQLFSRPLLTRVFLSAARREQSDRPTGKRPLSEAGWSILTGDRPYRAILRRSLALAPYWHLLRGAWALLWGKRAPRESDQAEECGLV